MDPNETLARIRATCHELAKLVGIRDDDSLDVLGYMLIEDFRNLDEWLSKGGFVPDAWNTYHQARGVEPLGPPDPAGVELP